MRVTIRSIVAAFALCTFCAVDAAGQGSFVNKLGPVKVGLAFAIIAIVMALIGLLRGSSTTPLTARSILMAVLISGGTWGVVSWAIATAVVEVE